MANPETTAAEPKPRKLPGKRVWIRLAIYVPLLGFFGWQAAARAIAEREAADDAFRVDMQTWLESPPGVLDLSQAMPVDVQAVFEAPPETGDDGTGTETTDTTDTGTTSETGGETIGTTGTTGTTSETGGETTGTTSETGIEPEPATTSTTTTGP